jgi:hypothetical protein
MSNSRLAMQKDRIIETLRLELAEAQIKAVELENMGGGRMHDLEKKLLESRIANARLMEDNESFQLLLSEKTLNGDFNRAELIHGSAGLGSLAEELETAEGESDNYRRLELEARSLKDQNKALTLYIENIVGRLLQHKEFENILDKTPDLMSGAPRPAQNREKELPPPPPKEVEATPSLLQRAKSVVGGAARSRPVSQIAPAPPTNIPIEDGAKAANIPPSHSQPRRDGTHRRSQSDMAYTGPLVNQMYRGPPSSGSGGPMSPGFTPSGMTARPSYFAPTVTSRNPSSSRTASASRTTQEQSGSSSNSTFSNHSAEVGNPSPPRTAGGINNYTGAVMTQSKLRPLRLVQENQEIDAGAAAAAAEVEEREVDARKKANRASWIPGWMNRGKPEDGLRPASAENTAV